MFILVGGLHNKKGAESHANLVPRLAKSLKMTIELCDDWEFCRERLAKSDGDENNKKIVQYALDYLIETEGPQIRNIKLNKMIDLEELKNHIKVCLYSMCIFHVYTMFIVCL